MDEAQKAAMQQLKCAQTMFTVMKIPFPVIETQADYGKFQMTLGMGGYLDQACGINFAEVKKTFAEIDTDMTWKEVYGTVYNECVEPMQPPMVYRNTIDGFSYLTIVWIMFIMGCDIRLDQCKRCLQKPFGVLVGLVCQFLFMPCISAGFAAWFSHAGWILKDQMISIVLIGASPGGVLSNLMCPLVDGDIDLSVTMTTVSTFAALGMLPLWLKIFENVIADGTTDLKIPYGTIGEAIGLICGPILLGMALKYLAPKVANFIFKIGQVLGITIIIVYIVIAFVAYPDAVNFLTAGVWVIAFVIPFIGAALGYGFSWALSKSKHCENEYFGHKQFRTVALETGAQNLSITVAILIISFIDCPNMLVKIAFYPVCYCVSQTALALVFFIGLKVYACFHKSADKVISGEDNEAKSIEVSN